jgi:hypothetical protein
LFNREVRLLVKSGHFAEAAEVADSALRVVSSPTPAEADSMLGVAGLTGRVGAASRLSKVDLGTDVITIDGGRRVPVPLPLAAAQVELYADATVGAPADSIRAAQSRVETLISEYMSPDQRPAVQTALVERAMSMAAPVLGPAAVNGMDSGNYLVHLEQLLARGDRQRLRKEFAALAALRRSAWPGATSIDATYLESWVRSAAGDTSGALKEMDQTLDALPATGNQLLFDLATAGSLPRMMMLRVDLDRDPASASRVRWAGAVCDLWAHADDVLQPDRQRMCSVAHRRV